MNDKVTKEQLEVMTVDQILGLNVDQIEELSFSVMPEGLYSGTVANWALPSEDNNNSFEVTVHPTAVIELENPEESYEITAESKVTARFGQAYPTALQAMRTNWEDFFVKAGNGNLGAAMANGDGTSINFRIEHRYITKDSDGKKLPKPKGPFAELRDIVVV